MAQTVEHLTPTKGAASAGWLGLRVGVMPLVVLVSISFVTLLGAAVARTVTVGFFAQQQAALAVVVAGFILAVGGYGITIARVMRRIAFWQAGGMHIQARTALCSLCSTALLVVLPLALAVLLPQHPAP